MSFFSSSSSAVNAYKPQAQIRQEGFHPQTDDAFNPFLQDNFRKFPSSAMDFTDELASLITHRPTHNIFDISAPQQQDYPTHFNQTLPALNSSLRYENTTDNPPPSSFHHFNRHTPSPIGASRSRSRSRPPSSGGAPTQPIPSGNIGPARTTRTRRNNSVSGTSPPPGRPHAIVIPRSRAATVSGNANGTQAGWYMPGHSASEFSLPTPDSLSSHHSHSHSLSHSHSHSLSHHSQHHSPSAQQNPYSPFSLSPPPESALHLPPVSALHSLHQQQQSYLSHHTSNPHHGSPHSLPTIHTNLAVPSVPSVVGVGVESPKSVASHATPDVAVPSKSDKQALLANEKRRRRRESHNAVERRRRDNINEKISELATLIPECLLDVGSNSSSNPLPPPASATSPKEDPSSPNEWKKDLTADPLSPDVLSSSLPSTNPLSASLPNNPTPANGNTNTNAGNGNGEGLGIVKANKGMILRKSVEYIRYLQQLVEAQGARNRELECELKRWRGRSPSEGSDGGMAGLNIAGQGDLGMGMYSAANVNMNVNGNGAFNFGLPSMPEGEGEGEENDGDGDEGEGDDDASNENENENGSGEDGMDVEGELTLIEDSRGRTRGVIGLGKKASGAGRKKLGGGGVTVVKEEGGQGEEMMVL